MTDKSLTSLTGSLTSPLAGSADLSFADRFKTVTPAPGNDELVKKILGVNVPVKAPGPITEITPASLDAKQLGEDKVKEDLARLHADLEFARDGRTEDNIPINANEPYWDKRNALQRYLHELKG